MVMVKMTMGNRATESPRSIPSRLMKILIRAMRMTTTMSTDGQARHQQQLEAVQVKADGQAQRPPGN